MKKICFKCKATKETTEFYKHPAMGDGHLGKCKDCTKVDARVQFHEKIKNPAFQQSEKDRTRERYHRLGYKDLHKPTPELKKIQCENYEAKYPEKKAAKVASNRVPCPVGFNKHHWSYNEKDYKDVLILNIPDHNTIHRFMNYDQEAKMYRVADTGELLSTRQLHVDFIQSILLKEVA